MRIQKIVSQHRRDFQAVYQCEHCLNKEKASGYDDDHFHQKVIPEMVCKKCNLKADKSYRALAPKYAAGRQV